MPQNKKHPPETTLQHVQRLLRERQDAPPGAPQDTATRDILAQGLTMRVQGLRRLAGRMRTEADAILRDADEIQRMADEFEAMIERPSPEES